MNTLRLAPTSPVQCDGYTLDAVAIEYDDQIRDFRFELGSGLRIYWALPIARGDRLRLVLVDCAAAELDEPSVIRDPFVFDLPQLAWQGDLATLPSGAVITAVSVEVSTAGYRCEVAVRVDPWRRTRTWFAWRA